MIVLLVKSVGACINSLLRSMCVFFGKNTATFNKSIMLGTSVPGQNQIPH